MQEKNYERVCLNKVNTELAYEIRVKKDNGKINSFHFTANNIDHARRRAKKKGRIISIKEVKREKLIGSLESMHLAELITPPIAPKPMITENMTIEDFFGFAKAVKENNNGGLNGRERRKHWDSKQRRADEDGGKY